MTPLEPIEPHITTYPSGKVVNPLNLQLDDIVLEDVAHHLAIQNRWCGASRCPYPTAQHAVFVARITRVYHETSREGLSGVLSREAEENWRQVALVARLQALHHDDSEYILGDVTKWLKMSDAMAGYREAEERAQAVLFTRWGVPLDLDHTVEIADRLMVRFEGMETHGRHWKVKHPQYPPINDAELQLVKYHLGWAPWTWREAKTEYLLEHARIMNDLTDLRDRKARKEVARATEETRGAGGPSLGPAGSPAGF